MADNPNSWPGFVPRSARGQGEYKGSVRRYVHLASDSNPIYKYQFVKRTGSGDPLTGRPAVTSLTNVYDDITGIVIGMEPIATDVRTLYCPASTYRVLLVADDPWLTFVAIGDDSGGTLSIDDVGNNIQWVAGTPSTITGHGNDRLASTTKGTGSQDGSSHNRNIRILDFFPLTGYTYGTSDKYKPFLCGINTNMSTETDQTGV